MAGWIQSARLLLTARCRDATLILSEEQDTEVNNLEWLSSRLHLLSCGPCRRYTRQMKLVDRILAEMPEDVREKLLNHDSCQCLSDEAVTRIRQALEEAIDE